jgi:two-component system response regulator RpaA
MSEKILVIDDDPSILELIRVNLDIQGYQVITAEDAIKGIALFNQESPDLIILDLMLPKLDGFTACQQLRADNRSKNTPILMLTAMSRVDDKIAGFDAGTDDYLTKPFEIGELIARVKALLRRAARVKVDDNTTLNLPNEILHSGDITLVPESREAQVDGKIVRFTPIEFEILYCLMQNLGKTVSPNQLLHDIWGYSPDDDIETIRVHIRHLRQRIEADDKKDSQEEKESDKNKKYIRTIYGKGYQLVPEGFLDD